MRKKNRLSKNYLERIPCRGEKISWETDEKGMAVLAVENKGIFNRAAQKLLKKPRISYIHLDGFGTFVWEKIDGKKDIIAIGAEVSAEFGEKAEPLYERLAQYFRILESYDFICFENEPCR